ELEVTRFGALEDAIEDDGRPELENRGAADRVLRGAPNSPQTDGGDDSGEMRKLVDSVGPQVAKQGLTQIGRIDRVQPLGGEVHAHTQRELRRDVVARPEREPPLIAGNSRQLRA